MSDTTVKRLLMRRGTAAQWEQANPALGDGEWGVERDTGRAKLGDGVTLWSALPYFAADSGSSLNVADYGATGDGTTDDTTAIQDAIDAGAASGQTVRFPAGTYVITDTILMPAGTRIVGDVGATIDCAAIGENEAAFAAWGGRSDTTVLTADAVEGTSTLQLTSVPSAVTGEAWLLVRSEAETGVHGQRKGEIVRVASVSGTTVTLHGPLADTYLTADTASIEVFDLKDSLHIEGLTIVGPADGDIGTIGMRFRYCRNVTVRNCTFLRCHSRAVELWYGLDIRIVDCLIEDARKTGVAYGIVATWAVQNLVIDRVTGRRMRTLTANGGGAEDYGVPRGITVRGCHASQMEGPAFSTHSGPVDVRYESNTVNGSGSEGILIRNAEVSLIDNKIRNCATIGIDIRHVSVAPLRVQIHGNRIERCTQHGIRVRTNTGWGGVEGVSIVGNMIQEIVQFNGIVCDRSGDVTGRFLTIQGNTIADTERQSIFVINWDAVSIVNNTIWKRGDHRPPVECLNVNDLVLSGNVVDGAGGAATAGQGVQLSNVHDGQINGNRVFGATAGIVLADTCSNCVVGLNGLRGNTTPLTMGTGSGHIRQTTDASGAYNRT